MLIIIITDLNFNDMKHIETFYPFLIIRKIRGYLSMYIYKFYLLKKQVISEGIRILIIINIHKNIHRKAYENNNV